MTADGAMARALALAAAQLGHTAPNPAVGCVIVREGAIVGEGATGVGGRPHAEERALAAAGAGAAGAHAYVTLEPCAARSAAGARSCTDLLIAARVARVIVAVADPHPNAAGAGLRRLQRAGIAVEIGLRGAQAAALNEGFFHRVRTGRPLLVLDADPGGYDAEFKVGPGETPQAALERLGRAGLTRVRLDPHDPARAALEGLGFVNAPRRFDGF